MRSVGPLLRGGRSQLQRRGFWSGAKSVQTQAAAAPAMDSSMELMSVAETERLLFDGIRAIGYNDADATVMRDAMMWAQLRDNNQGIIKLTSGGLAKSGDGQPTLEIDTPTGGRLNGNQAMSMVVINRAVEIAIEKALTSNAGIVGTFNTSQSMGAVGFYAEKIAAQANPNPNPNPHPYPKPNPHPHPNPRAHPHPHPNLNPRASSAWSSRRRPSSSRRTERSSRSSAPTPSRARCPPTRAPSSWTR